MTPVPAPVMDLDPEQARAFIGPRADYYLTRWRRIAPGAPRSVGFNGAAFLFTVFWLLYRRMYRAFWMMMGVAVAVGALGELAVGAGSGTSPVLDLLGPLAVATTFGTFGTYWYYRHARRLITRVAAAPDPSLDAIGRAGGTSWLAAALGAAVLVSLGILGMMADPALAPPP